MKSLFFVGVVFLLVVCGCSGVIEETKSVEKQSVIDNPIVVKNIVVKDSNNGTLGYAVNVSEDSLLVLSSKGYSYRVDWSGNFVSVPSIPNATDGWSVFYSNTSCTGTPYRVVGGVSNKNYYGKEMLFGVYLGKLYIPKTVDSNGTAYYDKSNKVTINSIDVQSSSFSGCQTGSSSYYAIELSETNRTTVGIPETITAPIILEFQ